MVGEKGAGAGGRWVGWGEGRGDRSIVMVGKEREEFGRGEEVGGWCRFRWVIGF